MKNICLIGAFDVKDAEYAFVRQQILDKGHKVISVNAGVLGTTEILDIEADGKIKLEVKILKYSKLLLMVHQIVPLKLLKNW